MRPVFRRHFVLSKKTPPAIFAVRARLPREVGPPLLEHKVHIDLAARLEGVADPDGITMSYETYALVKEFVDAEKGEPIHVKGIHRTINPYKLIGIYKNVDEKSRFFRSENDGMKLFLDFEKLDEDTRPEAIDQMKAAIERLSESETTKD